MKAAADHRRSKDPSSSTSTSLSKKVVKKSLTPALTSVATADSLPQSSAVISEPKPLSNAERISDSASSDFVRIPEALAAVQKLDSTELVSDSTADFTPLSVVSAKKVSAEISDSSESSTLSDLTSFGKVACISDELFEEETSVSGGMKFSSVEACVVADHLKRAGIEVLRAKDVDEGVKKLVHSLINVLLKEVYVVADRKEEKDRVERIVSVRVWVVSVCLLVWMVVIAAMLMSVADDRQSFGIPPT